MPQLFPPDFATSTQFNQNERRRSTRFALEREVRYRVLTKKGLPETGNGRTVNMSSTGVLFLSEQPLPAGRTVELDISWPAQLNNTCGLKLVARGRIVRAGAGYAAIAIQHHEFRTQGSQALAAAARAGF